VSPGQTALLAAGGIGDVFFCHLRLACPGNAAALPELAASQLAWAEQALGPVASLAAWQRAAAGGGRHLLVQARHAGGLAELQLRLGGAAARCLEATLEGRAGTLQLDEAGVLRRHSPTGVEILRVEAVAPPPPSAPDRLTSLLLAELSAQEAALDASR
jgi:hypothetical protein